MLLCRRPLSLVYTLPFLFYFPKRTFYHWSDGSSAICNTGKHLGQSFLENLQPLTPEVTEDAEDLQALEYMAVHGVFGSGMYYIKLVPGILIRLSQDALVPHLKTCLQNYLVRRKYRICDISI